MSTFPLRIGTPDGLLFEGDVERVVCRSVGGDLAILARHCNFCTAPWYGRSQRSHGGRDQTDSGLHRRNALRDERNLASSTQMEKKISMQSVRRQQKNAPKK